MLNRCSHLRPSRSSVNRPREKGRKSSLRRDLLLKVHPQSQKNQSQSQSQSQIRKSSTRDLSTPLELKDQQSLLVMVRQPLFTPPSLRMSKNVWTISEQSTRQTTVMIRHITWLPIVVVDRYQGMMYPSERNPRERTHLVVAHWGSCQIRYRSFTQRNLICLPVLNNPLYRRQQHRR
jgi:hypothetical protein